MTDRIVLGIDPGKYGAMAVYKLYYTNAQLLYIVDFNPDIVLKHMPNDFTSTIAYLENVHAAPRQGSAATFNFGKNFGWWLGVLNTKRIPIELVSPQKWQPKMFKEKPADTKKKSLEVARSLFPDSQYFKRAKDHGRSDAALIGAYGIQTLGFEIL